MGKNQIKFLKLLGYGGTIEDGAILQHPSLSGTDKYVWKDDKFESVLSNYSMRLIHAERERLSAKIIRG